MMVTGHGKPQPEQTAMADAVYDWHDADDETPPRSIAGVIVISLVFLGLAHLSVKTFFPNAAFWVAGLSIMVGLGLVWIMIRNDDFEILLALFVCTHFAFADQQGSLWSYLAFTLFLARLVFNRNFRFSFGAVSFPINLMVLVFLAHQIIGLAVNPYPWVAKLQGIVISLAHLFVFYWFASQPMTDANTRRFLSVWFLVCGWMVVVVVNQKFHLIDSPSPLLYHAGSISESVRSTPIGTFMNSELNAEYFCSFFLIAFLLIVHGSTLNTLGLRRMTAFLMVALSLFVLVAGGARSAVILACMGLFYITVVDFILLPSVAGLKRFVFILGFFPLLGVLVYLMSNTASYRAMADDFRQLDQAGLNVKSVVSGQGINRGGLFDLALRELSKKPRWIGAGYGTQESNRKSLGIEKKKLSGYHSLYLSLPFFFGWLGSAAFILIVLFTGLRAWMAYMGERSSNHVLTPLALGFALMWGVFLVDQYKISVTRNPGYFLLTWMLLGLTHAVVIGLSDREADEEVYS